MESILITTKKMLGIDADYSAFDVDVTVNINSALMTLQQLGVGPAKGFIVTDKGETWKEFLGDYEDVEAVKTYVYLKTKLAFDPPTITAVIEAIERMASELEWRICAQMEVRTEARNQIMGE